MAQKKVYKIDGAEFTTFEEFVAVINQTLRLEATWGGSLDAFNDILRGGFGTPDEGFILRWKNSKLSQQCLGYEETVRQLEVRLQRCHPAHQERVAEELALARNESGRTVFDWLVEIIETHGPGGREEEGGVELILE